MGLQMADGFVLHTNVPIDSRFEAATFDEMLNYEDRDAYEGLTKFCIDDRNLYAYDSEYENATTGHFKRVGFPIDRKTITENNNKEIMTAVGGEGGLFTILENGSHECTIDGDKKTFVLDWVIPEEFKFPNPSMGAGKIIKANLEYSFQWGSAWGSGSWDFESTSDGNRIYGPMNDNELIKWEIIMDWDAGTGVLNLYKDPTKPWSSTLSNVYGGAKLNLVTEKINTAKFIPIDEKTIIYSDINNNVYGEGYKDSLKTSIDGVIKTIEPKDVNEKAISSGSRYFVYSYPYPNNSFEGLDLIHIPQFPTINAHVGSATGTVATTWEVKTDDDLHLNWVPQYSQYGDIQSWRVEGEWEATTDPESFPKIVSIDINSRNGSDITVTFDNPVGTNYFVGFEAPEIIASKSWIPESAPIDYKTISITNDEKIKATNIRVVDYLENPQKQTEVIFRLTEDYTVDDKTYKAGLYMYEEIEPGVMDWVPVGGSPIDEKTIIMGEDGKIKTAAGGYEGEISTFDGTISPTDPEDPTHWTKTISIPKELIDGLPGRAFKIDDKGVIKWGTGNSANLVYTDTTFDWNNYPIRVNGTVEGLDGAIFFIDIPKPPYENANVDITLQIYGDDGGVITGDVTVDGLNLIAHHNVKHGYIPNDNYTIEWDDKNREFHTSIKGHIEEWVNPYVDADDENIPTSDGGGISIWFDNYLECDNPTLGWQWLYGDKPITLKDFAVHKVSDSDPSVIEESWYGPNTLVLYPVSGMGGTRYVSEEKITSWNSPAITSVTIRGTNHDVGIGSEEGLPQGTYKYYASSMAIGEAHNVLAEPIDNKSIVINNDGLISTKSGIPDEYTIHTSDEEDFSNGTFGTTIKGSIGSVYPINNNLHYISSSGSDVILIEPVNPKQIAYDNVLDVWFNETPIDFNLTWDNDFLYGTWEHQQDSAKMPEKMYPAVERFLRDCGYEDFISHVKEIKVNRNGSVTIVVDNPSEMIEQNGTTSATNYRVNAFSPIDSGNVIPIDNKSITADKDTALNPLRASVGGGEIHTFDGNIWVEQVSYDPNEGIAYIPFTWEKDWDSIKDYFNDDSLQAEICFDDARLLFTYTDEDGVDKEIDALLNETLGLSKEPYWYQCHSGLDSLNKSNSQLRIKIPIQDLRLEAEEDPLIRLYMSNKDMIKSLHSSGSVHVTIAPTMHNAVHVPVDYATITTEEGKLKAEVIRSVREFTEESLMTGVVYKLEELTTFRDTEYKPGVYIYDKANDELISFVGDLVAVDDFTIVTNPANENKIETVIGGGWKDTTDIAPIEVIIQDAGNHCMEIWGDFNHNVRIDRNTKVQVEIKYKNGGIFRWKEPFFSPREVSMEERPDLPWDPTWIGSIDDVDTVYYSQLYHYEEGTIEPTSFMEGQTVTCTSGRRIVLFYQGNWFDIINSVDDVTVTLTQQYDIDGTFVPIDYNSIKFDRELEALKAVNTKTLMNSLRDCGPDNIYYLSEDYYPRPLESPDYYFPPGMYTMTKDQGDDSWVVIQPVIDDRTIGIRENLGTDSKELANGYLEAKNVRTQVETLENLKWNDVTHKLKQEWTDAEGKVYAKGGVYAYDETTSKVVPYIAPDEISMSFDEDGYITAINTKTLLDNLEGCKENNIYHLKQEWTDSEGNLYKKGLYTWDKENNIWVGIAGKPENVKTFVDSLLDCEEDMLYHLTTEFTHPDTLKVYQPGIYSYNLTTNDWELVAGVNGKGILGDSTSTSLEIAVNLTQEEYNTLVANDKVNPETIYIITDVDSPVFPTPGQGNVGDVLVKTSDGSEWRTPTNSISATSTDGEIPTAKAVYDLIGEIKSALDLINYGG